MSAQPEALRLAEVSPYLEGGERGQWIIDAAAELRRLHAENERLWFENGDLRRCSQLEEVERYAAANRKYAAQRDALLEALRAMRVKYGQYACRVCDLADAAIKAVEGENT